MIFDYYLLNKSFFIGINKFYLLLIIKNKYKNKINFFANFDNFLIIK